jgi:hypothetical protein
MASAVLRLHITGSRGAYQVSADIGDKRESDTLGPLPDKLRENLQRLQEAILFTTESIANRAPTRPRPTAPPPVGNAIPVRGFAAAFADTKGIQEIGHTLFDCVFQPAVYKLYQESLEAALANQDLLHIKLCLDAPDLSYIPWETMFDHRGLFYLSCNQWTPFARATLRDRDLHIYDEPPLRILCMVSAPSNFIGTPYELQTDIEQAALDFALAQLKRQKKVKLCWTASGTQRELATRIVKGDDEGKGWDVFLFIGHGLEGQVLLEEDGGGSSQVVSADTFRGVLSAPKGPKLVILNSCKGATKPEDRLASTAETLVKGGTIAAVVAMQFDVSDIMATKFSPSFFSNLMLDVPIQQAMTLTRLELQGAGFSEWISPVLYMQNKDKRVLRDGGAAANGGA